MIGIWQDYAGTYLLVVGVAMLLGFGLPLVLAPMSWARVFRWVVPPPSPLATFLGRSLGVFICVVAAYAIRIASVPSGQGFFFELMIWIVVAMLALHLYGAIKREQPITETIEIGLWAALILVTLAFYPAG